MLNTDQPIFQDLKSTIKSGDLPKVQSLFQEWRSDSSIPGPAPSDIDELVPRTAEGVGQPAILEYLLLQGGSSDIDTYTVGKTQSPQIFEIFIKNGWKLESLQRTSSQPRQISKPGSSLPRSRCRCKPPNISWLLPLRDSCTMRPPRVC